MAKQYTLWQRHKYKLNSLVLILPFWFLYQSLTPTFPPAWPEQQLGPFSVAPMPLNDEPPYVHHGEYVKDFMLTFSSNNISQMRQGYFMIGPAPLPLEQLQQGDSAILHGNRHSQHVHALANGPVRAGDKAWLVIEDWSGKQYTSSWPMPEMLITQP